VALAEKAGDLAGQAQATRLLGWALGQLGRHEEAVDPLRHAAALAEKAGDLAGQSVATFHLGWALGRLGRHEEAVDPFRHAAVLAEKSGDLAGQSVATRHLGWALGQLGRHEEAVAPLRHAAALAEKAGDLAGQSVATLQLGWVLGKMGRYSEAVDTFRHATALAEKTKNFTTIFWAECNLMQAAQAIGDNATFLASWQRAISAASQAPDNNEELSIIMQWLDDAVAAALRSRQFGAVWKATSSLQIKGERPITHAQHEITEIIAEASLKQGRAVAYSLAADWIEVLAQDATTRVSRDDLTGPEPIEFLRGSLPSLAQRVTDPALLRDIAALLEQRLPSQTTAERALLEAAALRAERPDDPAALERVDPDVVTALERVLGASPKPASKPPPRRGQRSGTPRRKK
jgi:tetratricopeptide (TPR) repeat protein